MTTDDVKIQRELTKWAKEYLIECWENDDFTESLLSFGEVNTSLLAVEIVYESDMIPKGKREAALDDETHPVWDAIIDAAEWFEEKLREGD